ncbi:MAG: B12-binding domain-containing radical SAM protein, partial [Clostridia bacterium]
MTILSEHILKQVDKPARYIGGEMNTYQKDLNEIDVRFAFAFPDVYEVGMSHLGMQILYHFLNRR